MKTRTDIAVSAAFLLFGVFVIVAAAGFRSGTVRDPVGTAGLPMAAGIIIVALALVLVVRRSVSLIRDGQNVIPHEGTADEPEYPAAWWRPLAMWALGLAYILLLPTVGFWFATPVLVGVLVWLMHVRNPLIILAVALGFTAGAHGLFDSFLKVNLP